MATRLRSKLLKHNDEHQDCCFIRIDEVLYLIIGTKENRLSVHSVDTNGNDLKQDDEIVTTECIIDNITIKYESKMTQIMTMDRYAI